IQISGSSSTYGTDQTQRLLAMQLQDQQPAGQEMPGSSNSTTPASPAPTPPAGGAQLASSTLSGLLADQQSQPPSASDLAGQMIAALDTNGDGNLSADEITSALSNDKALSGDQVSAAVNKLDTNGDGKLSSAELQAGLQTAQARPGGHHHHHAAAASSDVATQLVSTADSNGDSQLSVAEINGALGGGANPSDALTTAVAKLDTNGDGSLSAAELTAALDAFRSAHHNQGQSVQPATTTVTA
ncbi:MAG: hypothetical protein JWP50_1076, partial [Phenylobacterium sp.]|nr:hypothetical protein [Phenylobacterium sp.]